MSPGIGRRAGLALAVLLLAAAGAAPGGIASAEAAKCKQRGGAKVCVSVKKQTCRSGRPTFCERWRNECRFRGRKGWYSCRYKAKQARCRGANGRRCRTTYINCTVNPRKRVCEEFTAAHCSSSRRQQRCQTVRNRCLIGQRTGFYLCRYVRRAKTCPRGKPCFRVTTRCVSRSRTRKASCVKNRYTVARDAGPGGADVPAGEDAPPSSGADGGTTDPEQPETTDDEPADEGSSGGGTITPL